MYAYDFDGVELVSFDSLATEANLIAREAVSLSELAELGGEGVAGIFKSDEADELQGEYDNA